MTRSVAAELKALAKMALDHRGERERIKREYFFRLARRFTPVLAADDGDLRFLVATEDAVIGRITFAHRGFDRPAMERAVATLAEHTGRPDPLRGRTLVDVGANIGTTSVYAVRLFGAARVVALEPAPGNLALLGQNLLANGVEASVDVHPVAGSSADGEVVLELAARDWGDHRVRPAGAAGPGGIVVPARSLDSLVSEGAIAPGEVAVLWIDVQGHELSVLQGAGRLLDAGVPVVTEYWPAALRAAEALDGFHALVRERFRRVVDLGHPNLDVEPAAMDASAVESLAGRYGTRPEAQGDLLLVP